MQKIEILTKNQEKDFSYFTVKNVWLEIDETESARAKLNNESLQRIVRALQNSENAVICIQTEAFSTKDSRAPRQLLEALHTASTNGNRVYILTNEKKGVLSELVGTCLIRYGQKNIGTLILINPQLEDIQDGELRAAIVYTGDLTETSFSNPKNLFLPISDYDEQIDDLYRFFCNNFWKGATHEWLDDKSEPKEVDIKLPFDFLPPYKNFCEFEFLHKHIQEKLKDATFVRVPEINADDFMHTHSYAEECEIMCNYSKNGFNGINSLEDLPENAEVFATTDILDMPYRMIQFDNDESVYFIPKLYLQPDDNIFAVKFTGGDVFEYIKNLGVNRDYQFGTFDKGDLGGSRVRFFDADTEVVIEEFGNIDCEDVVLNEFVDQAEFEALEPNFKYADTHPVTTNYQWRNIPFFTPADAKEDNIYADWQSCLTEAETSCSNGLSFIEALMKKKESGLQKLTRFFLGKNTQLQNHKKELEKIDASIRENNGYSETQFKQQRDKLNHLLDALTGEAKEIDLEMDKAHQEEKWEIKNKNLTGALAEIEKNIATNKQDKLGLEKQQQEKLDELEQKQEIKRQEKNQTQVLLDKQKSAAEELTKLEQEVIKQEEFLKMHQDSQANAALSEEDRQRNIKTSENALNAKKEDLASKKQQMLDEIKQKLGNEFNNDQESNILEQEIKQLKQELDKLEQDLKMHQASKPSANLSKKDRKNNITRSQKLLDQKNKQLQDKQKQVLKTQPEALLMAILTNELNEKQEKIDSLAEDKKVLEKKLKDDFNKNTQELNKLEASKRQKQRELDANGSVFIYQENKTNNNSKKSSLANLKTNRKNTDTGFKVEKAQLKIPASKPKVGILKRLGAQKFIEIEFWQEAEQAKLEAERFNAKISVKQ